MAATMLLRVLGPFPSAIATTGAGSQSRNRKPFPHFPPFRPALEVEIRTTPHVSGMPSPPPIFLPHLQFDDEEEDEFHRHQRRQQEQQVVEEEDGEEDDGEGPSDSILDFFKSRSSLTEDPKKEGRFSLQSNRRTSWRLADIDHATDIVEEEPAVASPSGVTEPPQSPNFGAVEEILAVARSLPENATLGDFLGVYAGKVGEGDCIELLVRMGEEGLASRCLYLFEWMGLQEPSLVTPRSFSVIFPVLGRSGMGDKLMILFQNLPKAKRFRDICVYNSAISGLASCGR